jgi:hypothetical protein
VKRSVHIAECVDLALRIGDRPCTGGGCDLGAPCPRHARTAAVVIRYMRLKLAALAVAFAAVLALVGCGGADPSFGLPAPTIPMVVPDAGSEASATAPDSAQPKADAVPVPMPDACVPHCPSGTNCGVADDGCGGQMQCGTCSGHETCGGSGAPGVCGCTSLACVPGQTCGTAVPDNCGGSLNCGSCPQTSMCERSSCLSFTSLGCQLYPDYQTCLGNVGADSVCVHFSYDPAAHAVYYLCPKATQLPTDLCAANPAGGAGAWDCRANP